MFNFGGLGNMASLLASAQQIPGKMKQLTEQLKQETVHATSGGGAVQVTLNGVGEMKQIAIDPAAKENPDLEAWIVEATNTAASEAKQRYAEAVSRMAKDMNINIPGLEGVLANLTGGA
jgi:nucleoid-associated protein EbfC